MIQLLPFPLMFGAGGGSASKPKTKGPLILAAIGLLVTSFLTGLMTSMFGWAGLLIIPALALWLCGLLLWGWLAVQCLDHSTATNGLRAGVYILGYVLAAMGGFATFAGPLVFVINLVRA